MTGAEMVPLRQAKSARTCGIFLMFPAAASCFILGQSMRHDRRIAMGFRTFGLAAAASLAAFLAASSGAVAQNYPTQRVTIVVPFSAGSITDGLARILADKLGTMWKQQVIVENKPGIPGTASVAKATPDGYTLMLTSNGHTIARAITKTLPFDPVKDFAGVTQVVSAPLVAITPPDLLVKTLQDFIDLAKQKPGTLNFS